MYVPLEHVYVGLSDSSSMERSSESSNLTIDSEKNNALNIKATELRLGLPGFSKDVEESDGKSGSVKSFVSGAKRGFSDVDVDGCRNWGLNGGSEADLNPRGGINACLESNQRRQSIPPPVSKHVEEEEEKVPVANENGSAPPAAKAQVVGWPPIRSFRKNTMATNSSKNDDVAENVGSGGCLFVKVSMDGAPYLRKVDLKTYKNYAELSKALKKLFSCFTHGECNSNGLKGREGLSENNLKDLLHASECVLAYEDKDGDLMLVGDVPWEMFIATCKRLRLMKGSEAIGLAPRSMEKCGNIK